MLQDIEDFCSAVPWQQYRSARIALLGFERSDGLHNLQTWVVLSHEAPSRRLERVAGHGLLLLRGRVPIDDVRQLLSTIAEKRGTVVGHEVKFHRVEGDAVGYSAWRPGTLDYAQQFVGWSAHALWLSGGSFHDVLAPTRFDWLGDRLITLRPRRFTSWAGVSRYLGAGSAELADNTSASVRFFAPVRARLGHLQYENGTGRLLVAIESDLDPRKEKLELVIEGPEAPTLSLQAKRWQQQTKRHWRASVALGQIAGTVTVHLVAGESLVWSSQMAVPCLAARLLHALDGGWEWLEGLLFPKERSKAAAAGFEWGLVALLGLGGLPITPTGHQSRDRYIDFLAFPDEHHLLVGECSIETPGPKKLSNLRARAEQLLARLEGPGQLAVLGCAFTPLPVAEIPEEIVAEAAKLGVVLVARDRLQALLALAKMGDLQARLWETLTGWRPLPPASLRRPVR